MTGAELNEILVEIAEKHGALTPDAVVEEARAKKHPLHTYVFDRPVAEAAEGWYRERARKLIRIAHVSYTRDGEIHRVRAWQPIRTESGYSFAESETVARDPVLREMVLRDMKREWIQLRKRYEEFDEFAAFVLADLGMAVA